MNTTVLSILVQCQVGQGVNDVKPDQRSCCLGDLGSGIHAKVPRAPYGRVEADSTLQAPLTPWHPTHTSSNPWAKHPPRKQKIWI